MHHREVLTEAFFAPFLRLAIFGDVALLQAFETNARAEASFSLLIRRRFQERVARRQLMIRAAVRAASRWRCVSAALARCGGSSRNFGAG